jgi:hypothetical protein
VTIPDAGRDVTAASVSTATVAGINVYPVKSCRGIAVTHARVATRGLALDHEPLSAGDREWMIVDDDGRFITQREVPRLALVEVAIDGGALRLSLGGVAIDVSADSRAATREVVVWGSTVPAHDAGPEVAAWLVAALGVSARLVRFDALHERRCNPQFVGDSGAHTMFADAYPLLVTSDASLADLNARIAENSGPGSSLPMNRFRPNLVLSGLPAWDEDHIATIEVDGVAIELVKPCTRCVTTTTDQATAVRGIEPLPTLARYRTNGALGGVTFGMNAIVTDGVGRAIAVGSAARCTYRF